MIELPHDVLKEIASQMTTETFWNFHLTCKDLHNFVLTHFSTKIKTISIIRRDTFFYNPDFQHETQYTLTIQDYERFFRGTTEEFPLPEPVSSYKFRQPVKTTYAFDCPIDDSYKIGSEFVKLLGNECKKFSQLKIIKLKLKWFPGTNTQFYFHCMHNDWSRFEEGHIQNYFNSFWTYPNDCVSIRCNGQRWYISQVYDIHIVHQIVIVMMDLIKRLTHVPVVKFTTPKLENILISFDLGYWSHILGSRKRNYCASHTFWDLLRKQLFQTSYPNLSIRSNGPKDVYFIYSDSCFCKLYCAFGTLQVCSKDYLSFRKIMGPLLQTMNSVATS